MKFVWSLGAEDDDKNLEKIENETSNKRMARLCGPAMNAINPDLVFTSEIPEVFKDYKVPTMDCKSWQLKD